MSTPAEAPEDIGNPPSRPPLKIISPTAPMQKQVRRKNPFVIPTDSSEDDPSSHDSIFEAYYISATNSEESGHKIELVSIPKKNTPGTAKQPAVKDENSSNINVPASTPSVDEVEFRYGHGTVLETITEQKSSNTMRTLARTKSADEIPKFPFLAHCDSFELPKSPRRKNSFSVDDVALIQRNYHQACAMIERETRKPLPVHEIYAQPKHPIHPPVDRPPTPPGMPSWTAAQSLPRRVQGSNNRPVQNRLQRFLGLPASGITLSSRVPPNNPHILSRTVSSPFPSRIAPRFRPPRSVYGPIDRHPFVNAPVAKVGETPPPLPATSTASTSGAQTASRLPRPIGRRKPGQRVRFTPSATARDSEMVSLQTAFVSTSASAMDPFSPIPTTPAHTLHMPVQIHCPHRKGRLEALKTLKNGPTLNHGASLPPSNEYRPLPSESPSRQGSTSNRSPANPSSCASLRQASMTTPSSHYFDPGPSRTASFSSTTHLMTGALEAPSSSPSAENLRGPNSRVLGNARTAPQKEPWCWKCAAEKGFTKIDQWWTKSTSYFCFVCCGIDIDNDMSVPAAGSATQNPFQTPPGGVFGQEIFGPSRVTLDHTPVVMG